MSALAGFKVQGSCEYRSTTSAYVKRLKWKGYDETVKIQQKIDARENSFNEKCSQNLSSFNGWAQISSVPGLHDLFESPTKPTSDGRNPSYDSGISLSDLSISDDTASIVGSVSSLCSQENRKTPTELEPKSVDSSLEPWELPSRAQQVAIVQQVEYYFSDDYLSRDAYFLRQIRRKKEGYLSIKLITNFKKLRKMVGDPRVTAYCLRNSRTLSVNEEGTKVKRVQEVPTNLKRFQAQNSVLVIGIPERIARIEAIMNIFCVCGDMSSVRLIRPGKQYPTEVMEYLEKRKSESIWTQVNAVIEYEKPESAIAACKLLHHPNNKHGISRVCLLTSQSRIRKSHIKENRKPKCRAENRSRDAKSDHSFNDWQNSPEFSPQRQGNALSAEIKANTREQIPSCHVNDREENISDNAWIQDVVNQVLKQTYHSSKILFDYNQGEDADELYSHDYFNGEFLSNEGSK